MGFRSFSTRVTGLVLLACSAAPSTEGDSEGVSPDDLVVVGTIVTMDEGRPETDRVLVRGRVLVRDGRVFGVEAADADLHPSFAEAKKIDVGEALVFPGLVNTHNHLAYNFLPPWSMPRVHDRPFDNMYDWMEGKGDFAEAFRSYDAAVTRPKEALMGAGRIAEIGKWAELKEIVGGTTTTQGSRSFRRPGTYNEQNEGFGTTLVRNLDIAGASRILQSSWGIYNPRPADAPPGSPHTLNTELLGRVHKAIKNRKLDAFMVHLAEGTDEETRNELGALNNYKRAKNRKCGPLAQYSTIIHGTPFGAEEFSLMARCKMRLSASPLDNLLYYGTTPNLADAVEAGVLVSIGTDWSPVGSKNLLVELKVVDFLNQILWGGRLTDEQIVRMVTANAADMVGWSRDVGRIREGAYADLTVISRDPEAPYRALIDAREGDVSLVVIGGSVVYGDATRLDEVFGEDALVDAVAACGLEKAFRIVTDDPAIPEGTQHVSEIEEELVTGLAEVAPGVSLSPLYQCQDPRSLDAVEDNPNVVFSHPEAAGLVQHLREVFGFSTSDE